MDRGIIIWRRLLILALCPPVGYIIGALLTLDAHRRSNKRRAEGRRQR